MNEKNSTYSNSFFLGNEASSVSSNPDPVYTDKLRQQQSAKNVRGIGNFIEQTNFFDRMIQNNALTNFYKNTMFSSGRLSCSGHSNY